MESLATKYSVSVTQLLLKWALQKGYCILPKSSQPHRIDNNAQLFHFHLDDADMDQLDGMDANTPLAWPMGNPLKMGL